MDKYTRESMEKIWGKDWDKQTFTDKVKMIDWGQILYVTGSIALCLSAIALVILMAI